MHLREKAVSGFLKCADAIVQRASQWFRGAILWAGNGVWCEAPGYALRVWRGRVAQVVGSRSLGSTFRTRTVGDLAIDAGWATHVRAPDGRQPARAAFRAQISAPAPTFLAEAHGGGATIVPADAARHFKAFLALSKSGAVPLAAAGAA